MSQRPRCAQCQAPDVCECSVTLANCWKLSEALQMAATDAGEDHDTLMEVARLLQDALTGQWPPPTPEVHR